MTMIGAERPDTEAAAILGVRHAPRPPRGGGRGRPGQRRLGESSAPATVKGYERAPVLGGAILAP